jgi:hypothetical protein
MLLGAAACRTLLSTRPILQLLAAVFTVIALTRAKTLTVASFCDTLSFALPAFEAARLYNHV